MNIKGDINESFLLDNFRSISFSCTTILSYNISYIIHSTKNDETSRTSSFFTVPQDIEELVYI